MGLLHRRVMVWDYGNWRMRGEKGGRRFLADFV